MTKTTDTRYTTFIASLALALAAWTVACGGGEGAAPPPGYAVAVAPVPAPQPVVVTNDLAVCQQACSGLVACGAPVAQSCIADCLAAPTFLNCARTAGANCNALALCTFREWSAETCGGEFVGVPRGAETCGTAANCEGNCTLFNQSASCSCACAASLHPSEAIDLLLNNACATTRCAACRTPGQGAACISCFQAACATQSARCALN